MFSYCGTYKAEGNSLTTKLFSAWVPGWVDTERKSKFEVSRIGYLGLTQRAFCNPDGHLASLLAATGSAFAVHLLHSR
jgi:Lipocalin-like domain